MPTNPTQSTATTKNANDAVYTLKQLAKDGEDLGLDGLNIADLRIDPAQTIGRGYALLSNPRAAFVPATTRSGDTYTRMVGVADGKVIVDGRRFEGTVVFTDYSRKARGNSRFDKEANAERNQYNNAVLEGLQSSGVLESAWALIDSFGGCKGSISTIEDGSLRKDVCVITIANVDMTSDGKSFMRPSQDEVFSGEPQAEVPAETPAQMRQRQREEARQAKAKAVEPEPASV